MKELVEGHEPPRFASWQASRSRRIRSHQEGHTIAICVSDLVCATADDEGAKKKPAGDARKLVGAA